jgi:ribosome maturation factor RimP
MSEMIVDKIRDFLESFLKTLGLELFDVQYRKEGHGWVLRIFIDSDTGVTHDHCRDVSRELGQYLDVEDLIQHAYSLEVSSPGLERPLRSTEDFRKSLDKKAKVRLHDAVDGEKIFIGKIAKVDGDDILVELEDGSLMKFTYEMFNKARLTL